MDMFNSFPNCSSSRQSEGEMRDLIMSGGGYARPQGHDPIVDETAQKVQQESNPIHTCIENMDILAESSEYSFSETSRSNAFGNGFEMTPNFNSVQQKEIVGYENNGENTGILDVSFDYSLLETSRSNDLGDVFEKTLDVKSVEQKEIVGVENNEENMDLFLNDSLDYSFFDSSRSSNALDESLEHSFLETSRSNAHEEGPEIPNVKGIEQRDEHFGRTSAEIRIPSSDLSGPRISRSSADVDPPDTPNAKCVGQNIPGDEFNERMSAKTKIPSSELSGLESSRSTALGDEPETDNVKYVEQKESMEDVNNEWTSTETRIPASEFSGFEALRSHDLGDSPEKKNVDCAEQKQIIVDENIARASAETRIPPSEFSGLITSSSNVHGDGPGNKNVECVEQMEIIADESIERSSTETMIPASELSGPKKVEELSKDVALHSDGRSLSLVQEGVASDTLSEDAGLLHDQGATVLTTDDQAATPPDAAGNLDIKQYESVQVETTNIAADIGIDGETPLQSKKRKSILVSPESTRVLRSRSQEKDKLAEPKAVKTEDGGADERRKVKREKKKEMKNLHVNEFSRKRKHLRYLLHRINFEQSLIDAYSGEGWKGQSLEKIKPEKELQRARSEILSCKIKIRNLFQSLDASLNQGKLPETLFDSEGEIDCDDIFCAKCGTEDVTLENDIILCDGVCDRGFHQYCLEPPLLKKDIPLDDEGWLCPACDCKDDCFDILNDFQGSRLSILDNWEKVFPDAAAAKASGVNMDDISNLQSDDSDDDNYNPDNEHENRKVSGGESSGKSEYIPASNVQLPGQNAGGLLDLPSDDSEDDDFDPVAPSDDDQPAEHESSSSDFTSDSEDLGAVLEDNNVDKDEGCVSSLSNHTKPGASAGKEKPTVCRAKGKGQSLSNELSSLLDSDATAISGKRHVARLDYKKLHDETYGDATSDSSDEEYGGEMGSKRKMDGDGIATSGSVRRKRARKCNTDTRVGKVCLKEIEQTNGEATSDSSDEEYGGEMDSKRKMDGDGIATSGSVRLKRARKCNTDTKVGKDCLKEIDQALDVEGHHTSSEAQGTNDACGSNVEGCTTSPEAQGKKNACAKEETCSGVGSNKRLSEAATQGLLESFNENQYPTKDAKDSLAKELGLKFQQVCKWFENARWSFRHTNRMKSKFAKISGINGTDPSATKTNESSTPKPEPETKSTTPPKHEPATESLKLPPSSDELKELEPLQPSPEKVITEGSTPKARILRCKKNKNTGNQSGGNASTSEPTTNQDSPVVDTIPSVRRKSTRLKNKSSS